MARNESRSVVTSDSRAAAGDWERAIGAGAPTHSATKRHTAPWRRAERKVTRILIISAVQGGDVTRATSPHGRGLTHYRHHPREKVRRTVGERRLVRIRLSAVSVHPSC